MDVRLTGLDDIDAFEASLAEDDVLRMDDLDDDPPLASGQSATVKLPDHDRPRPSTPGPSTPGSPPSPSNLQHERWIGKKLAHFRLMRVMGQGTMGVVFQVEDVNLRRINALKVLRRRVEGKEGEKQVERFMLEARAAAGIDHHSIAHVYEINQHHGWWYIAMEFMEGGSLKDLVQSIGPLPPAKAALYLADAARGLAAAHEAGVIHRDLKPANLMLNRRGRCKIVDFGLVKLDSAEDPFRGDKRFAGTPFYAAPEVIKQRGAQPASDIYSLGGTLFALIAGEPPFVGSDFKEVLKMHLEVDPPSLKDKAPGCTDSMAALVERMLSKEPALRPPASTVAAALQAEVSTSDFGSDIPGFASASSSGVGGSSLISVGSLDPNASRSAHGSTLGALTGAPSRPRAALRLLAALLVVAAAAAAAWFARPLLVGAPDTDTTTAAGTSGAADQPSAPPVTNTIGIRLAWIPPGDFRMGSPPSEPGRNNDERPVAVTISAGFYLSATEVTQSQWAAVMGDDYRPPDGVHPNDLTGLRFLGATLPAYVSWPEAAEFCRRLSLKENAHYRLPTEAEWEYACRAGTTTAFHTGDTLGPLQANIDADLSSEPTSRPARRPLPVASFPPNAWGLFDMHGNVMEWCADWKAEHPLGPLTDPAGPQVGDQRVIRGGSWETYARVARSANRWANTPVLRSDSIGFRVVRVPDETPPDLDPFLDLQASMDSARPKHSDPFAAPLPSGAPPPEADPALPSYTPDVVVDARLRTVGSDTMDRLIRLWENDFERWHAGIVFRHEGKGSGAAVPALVEGISHIGPMSRELKPAEGAQFLSEVGYLPTQARVAIDAIAVYVHRDNPVAERGLTLREIDAIFSSTRTRGAGAPIRTWGDLRLDGDWRDAPIRVLGRNQASGTQAVFRELVLLDGEYLPRMRRLVGSEEVVEAVARDRLAISFSGIGYNRPGVVAVPIIPAIGGDPVPPTPAHADDGSYPLTRPLYLTVDLPPGDELGDLQREFLRFVFSREGQRRVAEAGFFPLNAGMARDELRRLRIRPRD